MKHFKILHIAIIAILSFHVSCNAAPPVDFLQAQDVLLVTDDTGHIIFEKNATRLFVPASILKIYTALAAFHYFGPSYRFTTELYWAEPDTLKVKGFGDPLLISEVWEGLARTVAEKGNPIHTIVLDDSYFKRDIRIPGSGHSTNPYDAPIGALCANFNTVFFKRGPTGALLSAEPQTPLTPLAIKRIQTLGEKEGRYTFSHTQDDIVLYAGQLFAQFLDTHGANIDTATVMRGNIRPGVIEGKDMLLHVYRSRFTLEDAAKKMLKFSNNFMANQIVVAMGAREYGPPGDLSKGLDALRHYGRDVLHLKKIVLAEGSGISRKNRISAKEMMIVLKAFKPHRNLLVRKGPVHYKTGTLSGIRTRAGYIKGKDGRSYAFVTAVKESRQMKRVMKCIEDRLADL